MTVGDGATTTNNAYIFSVTHNTIVSYIWGEPERAPLKRYCIENSCLFVCPGGHP